MLALAVMRTAITLAFFLVACGDNIQPDGDAGPAGGGADLAGPRSNPYQPGPGPGEPDTFGWISTPTIAFVGSTSTSISIEVCAGKTGLPTGFVLAWSGCAVDSSLVLGPAECTTVVAGRLFDADPCVTSTCDELACGTEYAFRAWGHESHFLLRSATTEALLAATLHCYPQHDCTLTQGYWKNHEYWPLAAVALGATTYSEADMLAIFHTPARGNSLVTLAHQLAAARLDIAAGADPAAVADAIAKADALIGDLVAPPIGTGYLAPAMTGDLVTTLAAYNEGKTGPGHCVE